MSTDTDAVVSSAESKQAHAQERGRDVAIEPLESEQLEEKEQPTAKRKVFAVVVSYQPDITELQSNLQRIAPQVEQLVLVDNASAQQEAIITRCKKVAAVIPQPVNSGLGVAHNMGIEYARMHGASHVILFDQDSQPEANMVQALLDGLAERQALEPRVSAVGPSYRTQHTSADSESAPAAPESFFVRFGWLKFRRTYCRDVIGKTVPADFLISSGALFPMAALEDVGLMDEQLFIDHIDTEWFLRAHAKGYAAYGVCDAWMAHGLGERTRKVRGLFRERNVPQHKPFRYYYIFRNSVLLYRRRYVSKKWVWNDLQRLLQIFVFYGLLYPPRLANLRMMLKGIRHGLFNLQGRLKTEDLTKGSK